MMLYDTKITSVTKKILVYNLEFLYLKDIFKYL